MLMGLIKVNFLLKFDVRVLFLSFLKILILNFVKLYKDN